MRTVKWKRELFLTVKFAPSNEERMKLLKRIVQLPVERQALQSRVSADSKPVGGGGGGEDGVN